MSTSALVAVVVLIAAVGLQGLGSLRKTAEVRPPGLAEGLSLRPGDWEGRDLPLGATEFLEAEVEKVLNFDEAINREYRRGKVYFGVYVAYWGEGKMPTRLVASHTPDRCWTENGWRCLEMEFRKEKVVDGRTLQPGERRIFEPPQGGAPVHVLYWHLVSGQVYDYGERFNAVPSPWLWWKDAFQQALLGNREQFFIRLTSNVALDTLWDDPGFRQVVLELARLGLERPVGPPA